MYLKARKIKENRPSMAGEKLIEEGLAGSDGKGGWIYLTDARLYYVSPDLEFLTNEFSFALSDIESAEKNRTFGLFLNKLVLNLRNGKSEKFVVQDARNRVNKIKKVSGLSIPAPRDLKYL